MPEEAIQGFLDLKGKVLVPVHWGMFNLAIHNWYDPIQESVKYSSKYENLLKRFPNAHIATVVTFFMGTFIGITDEKLDYIEKVDTLFLIFHLYKDRVSLLRCLPQNN